MQSLGIWKCAAPVARATRHHRPLRGAGHVVRSAAHRAPASLKVVLGPTCRFVAFATGLATATMTPSAFFSPAVTHESSPAASGVNTSGNLAKDVRASDLSGLPRSVGYSRPASLDLERRGISDSSVQVALLTEFTLLSESGLLFPFNSDDPGPVGPGPVLETTAELPEPASIAMLGIGLLGLRLGRGKNLMGRLVTFPRD